MFRVKARSQTSPSLCLADIALSWMGHFPAKMIMFLQDLARISYQLDLPVPRCLLLLVLVSTQMDEGMRKKLIVLRSALEPKMMMKTRKVTSLLRIMFGPAPDSVGDAAVTQNPHIINEKSVREYKAHPIPTGSILPTDGQPQGTLLLRGHDAEVHTDHTFHEELSLSLTLSTRFSLVIGILLSTTFSRAGMSASSVCHLVIGSDLPCERPILPSFNRGKGGQVIIWRVHEAPNARMIKTEVRRPLHSILAVLPPPRRATKEPKDLTSIAWNHQGTLLCVGHQDATIQLWGMMGQPLASQTPHAAPVFDLSWSPDSTKLVSAGLDGLSILWDMSAFGKMTMIAKNREHESELIPKLYD